MVLRSTRRDATWLGLRRGEHCGTADRPCRNGRTIVRIRVRKIFGNGHPRYVSCPPQHFPSATPAALEHSWPARGCRRGWEIQTGLRSRRRAGKWKTESGSGGQRRDGGTNDNAGFLMADFRLSGMFYHGGASYLGHGAMDRNKSLSEKAGKSASYGIP